MPAPVPARQPPLFSGRVRQLPPGRPKIVTECGRGPTVAASTQAARARRRPRPGAAPHFDRTHKSCAHAEPAGVLCEEHDVKSACCAAVFIRVGDPRDARPLCRDPNTAPVGARRVRVPQTGGITTDLLDPSAWRNFPGPRKPRRKVGRPRKCAQLNMFYGITEARIADWCGVGISTVTAWASHLHVDSTHSERR